MMALDAIVTLAELACLELSGPTETRVEPYIWPMLIWVDDTTITNPAQPIRVNTITVGNARKVIKDSMRAGETAPIPAGVGALRMRFDETVTMKHLILVVALLENDESPADAMRAGFRAFVSELTAAVTSRLLALGTTTGEQRDAIVEEIKKQVSNAVASAIEDNLTAWEKVKVFAGTLNLDDAVGAGFFALDNDQVSPGPITMAIEGTGRGIFGLPTRSRFEIRGRLHVQGVVVDPCEEQVKAVNEAQAVVNGIEQQIKELQDQLSGQGEEPPLPKDFILAEIDRIREEELVPAMAALDAARAALLRCRAGTGRIGDPRRQVQGWVNDRWVWVTESKVESCGPAVARGAFQALTCRASVRGPCSPA